MVGTRNGHWKASGGENRLHIAVGGKVEGVGEGMHGSKGEGG